MSYDLRVLDEQKTIGRYASRASFKTAEPALTERPVGYILKGDGKLEPIAAKSGFAWGGNGNFSFSITSPYSDVPINSYPMGYAYASVVSVWASRCIEIRATAVSRIKRSVVDKRTGKPIANHPLQIAINRAYQHGEDIYALWEHSKLVFGEVFLWPIRNQYQSARFVSGHSDLAWLNNLGVNVLTMGGYISGYTYAPVNGGRMSNFAAEDMAFYRTRNLFNNLRGLSPLDSILLELGIEKNVSRVTKAFYDNDARPAIILIPQNDMDIATSQAFTDYWNANLQGAKNAGKTILSPAQIKDVKEIQRPPNVDDVEIRESMRREICARFGVPLSIAGAWDDAQYQSAPEQRKSLYEETIIPECEDCDKWFTTAVLPYFDDSDGIEVKSDLSDIKALIEDEGIKASVSNQRLLAGGITRNEYRHELDKPPLPGDDMLYIPAGVQVIPVNQAGKPVMPAPTSAPPQAAPPADGQAPKVNDGSPTIPKAPSAPIPSANAPAAPGIKTEQEISDEFHAWRKKAMNGGPLKALAFICYALPKDVESHIRSHLRPDMDKTALKAVFDEAGEGLKKKIVSTKSTPLDGEITATPEQAQAHWENFDKLYAEVGADWLNQYMHQAFEKLKPHIRRSMSADDVLHILEPLHSDLAADWLGTPEKPGVITQLVQAGMAAGNHALEQGRAENPVKASAGVTVDWTLLNQQAYDFAKSYIYDLIRGLDNTTRTEVQSAISNWIASGEPLSVLESQLEGIFNDVARAALIAQTESTRVYNEGAKQRWTQVGVKSARWQTVNDSLRCKVCKELHNQEFDLSQGAWSEILSEYVQAPAHPGCRCFARPIVPPVEDLPTDVKPESSPTLTTTGYMPVDTGIPGKTIESLTQFLNKSEGPLANSLKDIDLGLTQLNWDTDQYEIDNTRVKEVAKQFVAESQNIQYGKDYILSLVQQDMAEKGIEIDQDTAEKVYNDFYANRAEAIYISANIGDVKLTEAQSRRLETAMTSNYLDMVYTTDTSLAGSLANQTKRKVTYGGNFYASEGARREARREFLDRLGFLDTGGG